MTHEPSDNPASVKLSSPGVLEEDAWGQVYLVGHRITLFDIVHFYNEGYSAEMLAGQFPTLPLAHVHKVIAFYLENAPAVDRYVAREAEAIAKQRAEAKPGPTLSELRRRLAVARAG